MELDSLDKVDFNSREQVRYNYKTVNFSFNSKTESDYLIVSFHGSKYIDPKTSDLIIPPMFTYYSSNPIGYDILCMCDKVIEIEDYNHTWFLSSEKYNYFPIYREIIESILLKTYKNILFTGTSAGGFPAIVFSSIFKQTCLVQNCQIYLDKWYDGSYFKKLNKSVTFISENDPIDLELFIKKHGTPKKLVMYINKNDKEPYINHTIPFSKFMLANYPTNFKLVEFNGYEPVANQTHHHISVPTGKTRLEIILESLKTD